MTTEATTSENASEACQLLLRSERDDRVSSGILRSEVKVIDRLLSRSLELRDAYEELHSKLNDRPPALKVFFDILFRTAAFWNPDANREARQGRARLVEVNREIEEAASTLAALLNERTELKNHSGFSCDTLYHPVDAIDLAAADHYRYQHWVKNGLAGIRGQFDLKYWPSLSEVVQAIGTDAAQARPLPHDAVTEAGTEGPRAALADTFRSFYVALEESSAQHHGFLPRTFELTDRSVAALISCALDLGPDEVVDAGYVKRLRQRRRDRHANGAE